MTRRPAPTPLGGAEAERAYLDTEHLLRYSHAERGNKECQLFQCKTSPLCTDRQTAGSSMNSQVIVSCVILNEVSTSLP